MPAYEYRCLDCRKRFEVFMSYSEYGTREVTCTHCGSARVQRRIGRVRVARSDESRLESLADPDNLAGLEDDPRTLGRMMRQMKSELGEDNGGCVRRGGGPARKGTIAGGHRTRPARIGQRGGRRLRRNERSGLMG